VRFSYNANILVSGNNIQCQGSNWRVRAVVVHIKLVCKAEAGRARTAGLQPIGKLSAHMPVIMKSNYTFRIGLAWMANSVEATVFSSSVRSDSQQTLMHDHGHVAGTCTLRMFQHIPKVFSWAHPFLGYNIPHMDIPPTYPSWACWRYIHVGYVLHPK
jgi:hypothetical protein